MNNISLMISIFAILAFPKFSHGQEKPIDQFKVKKNRVEVFFYDPLKVLAKSANFTERSNKEKSDLLDNYLHNNPLYLFLLTDSKTKEITYLCIRGNPEKLNTKMFYKVEVIKGIVTNSFNPDTDNYSDKIVKVIDRVNCGGTLFENMWIFSDPEKKKYIGNGIELFGKFRRVQPYSEIKASIESIIKQLGQVD